MSDSELSDAPSATTLPDSTLEKSLRQEVIKAQKAGVDLTVNSIRTASETALGLETGFYKSHAKWSGKSKQIIREQHDTEPLQSEPPPAPSPPSKKVERRQKILVAPTTAKRSSEERDEWPRKRKKTVQQPAETPSSEELSSPPSDADSESYDESPKKRKKPQMKQKKPKAVPKKKTSKPVETESDDENEEPQSSTPSDDDTPKKPEAKRIKNSTSRDSRAKGGAVKANPVDESGADSGLEDGAKNGEQSSVPRPNLDSDSELSSLIDDDPAPKKRQKSETSTKSSKSTKKSTKAKSKADIDVDPDQAEIKRLQGWLTKCGIRKMWYKELQPYDTSKAKIKHLKAMLADVGMTGRYSMEKANQIRDARELAADIEAVQEGAERWGKEGDEGERGRDEAGAETRPARRLVRGARNYDFLSSDGEETD